MTDPIAFDTSTPRHRLPLLYAGQSQKEAFVNESAARIDVLLHCAIEGQAASPPPTPVPGECWLVAAGPGGAWTGHAGELAAFTPGGWVFCDVRDGMRLLDRSSGQEIRFHGSWKAPGRPAAPTGGSTIDVEARTALAGLIAVLTEAGIVPAP